MGTTLSQNMARIAVFDSGFGSMSIIKSIQKFTKSEIIYFADQKNYPYGGKSKSQLRKIIHSTIKKLEDEFTPDLLVVASNTPSILLKDELDSKYVTVLPPLREAAGRSQSEKIGILGSRSLIKSRTLDNYIKKTIPKTAIKKIDATVLIDLVESGRFLTNQEYCRKKIQKTLGNTLDGIDVVTLSSTHLPFLLSTLQIEFPSITFLDPAEKIGMQISAKLKKSKRNTLKIYTSKDPVLFQKHLKLLGFKNTVSFLS
jgi:glutamate racemase